MRGAASARGPAQPEGSARAAVRESQEAAAAAPSRLRTPSAVSIYAEAVQQLSSQHDSLGGGGNAAPASVARSRLKSLNSPEDAAPPPGSNRRHPSPENGASPPWPKAGRRRPGASPAAAAAKTQIGPPAPAPAMGARTTLNGATPRARPLADASSPAGLAVDASSGAARPRREASLHDRARLGQGQRSRWRSDPTAVMILPAGLLARESRSLRGDGSSPAEKASSRLPKGLPAASGARSPAQRSRAGSSASHASGADSVSPSDSWSRSPGQSRPRRRRSAASASKRSPELSSDPPARRARATLAGRPSPAGVAEASSTLGGASSPAASTPVSDRADSFGALPVVHVGDVWEVQGTRKAVRRAESSPVGRRLRHPPARAPESVRRATPHTTSSSDEANARDDGGLARPADLTAPERTPNSEASHPHRHHRRPARASASGSSGEDDAAAHPQRGTPRAAAPRGYEAAVSVRGWQQPALGPQAVGYARRAQGAPPHPGPPRQRREAPQSAAPGRGESPNTATRARHRPVPPAPAPVGRDSVAESRPRGGSPTVDAAPPVATGGAEAAAAGAGRARAAVAAHAPQASGGSPALAAPGSGGGDSAAAASQRRLLERGGETLFEVPLWSRAARRKRRGKQGREGTGQGSAAPNGTESGGDAGAAAAGGGGGAAADTPRPAQPVAAEQPLDAPVVPIELLPAPSPRASVTAAAAAVASAPQRDQEAGAAAASPASSALSGARQSDAAEDAEAEEVARLAQAALVQGSEPPVTRPAPRQRVRAQRGSALVAFPPPSAAAVVPAEAPVEWRKGELLGSGTFGRVYMALNLVTGHLFAAKEVRNLAAGTSLPGAPAPEQEGPHSAQDQVTELQAEIATLRGLRHPHIVCYLGSELSDDGSVISIFTEYVPGGSVAAMLRQFGAFSETVIQRYTRQIVAGVAYLHAKGIIHRDIKGANVLVSETGIAKLADFGCSKQLQGLQTQSMDKSMQSLRGSVFWMAPEVIKQSGHGRRADIWSIGCTVLEMATGRHPWPQFDDHFAAMFHIATSAQAPPLGEVQDRLSHDCLDFLAQCFAIDPKDRPRAAQLLHHPFLAPAAGLELAGPDGLPPQQEPMATTM